MKKKGMLFVLLMFFCCVLSVSNVYAEEITDVEEIIGDPVKQCPLSGLRGVIFFDSNGGEDISSISLVAPVDSELPVPSKSGSSFVGWYYDKGLTNIVEVKYVEEVNLGPGSTDEDGCHIAPAITLYAKWSETAGSNEINPETGYFISIMSVLIIGLGACYAYKFSLKYRRYKRI